MIKELTASSAVWGVLLTIAAFALGSWLHHRLKKAWCNPLLFGCIFVVSFLSIFDISYTEYKASASPVSYLLLPATISLAIPLYEKWELLKRHAAAIIIGIFSGVLTSLGSIWLLAVLLKLSRQQYATLLPKSVTTAIGMDVAAELGGIAALASALIILTGIIGGLIAERICKIAHIKNAVAKGVAIGTSSHAIGTAKAIEMGETEGAMSSLAIVISGILTALLAPLFVSLL